MDDTNEAPRPVSPTQALQSLVSQLQAAAARAAANSAAGEATSGNVAALNDFASAPTLQSILAAVSAQAAQTQAAAGGATDTPPWQTKGIPGSSGAASTSAITSSSLGKHAREDSEEDDSHPRTKRIGLQASGLRRGLPMTTVICLHAAVAQKSYSTEKRFLCPPPVVHVEGSILRMRTQHLSMSVVSETGERSFDQKVALDKSNAASFKFLHVAGTGKAKSFQLTLDISEPGPSATNLDEQSPSGRTWASFDSAPVTIISKPSKKTAKTRNISSCILAGGPVSLFNRINSQTVRTKYMTIENSQLCASNTTWSAFTVNVARRSADTVPAGGPTAVTYGSEIILSDASSGISTAPLVVRKVEKNRIVIDDGAPVSQMQKIALQRINPDGTRHYLSAAYQGPQPSNNANNAAQNISHPLLFTPSRLREETRNGVRTIFDELDDALCWTIVGISKFQYTFFDAFDHRDDVPQIPITPFPTLYTVPLYRLQNNTLELTAANFCYTHPQTQQATALDVYLGHLGPLKTRIYQSPNAMAQNGGAIPHRFAALGGDQSIIVVDMPSMKEILKALAEEMQPDPSDDNSPSTEHTRKQADSEHVPSPQEVLGRTIPLLFIRSYDGVGYHSGRSITLENVFAQLDLGHGGPPPGMEVGWLNAASQAVGTELGGWTLRIL